MKDNFVIVTDVTADLYDGYYEEHPTPMVPFPYIIDGKEYGGLDDYPILDFYRQLKEGHLVKTSQANQYVASEILENELKKGLDILFICFSSGMSGSYNSMVYAANGLKIKYPERRIEVIDSLSGAGGEGLLVYYAKKMQDEGKSMDEIIDWLEKNKLHAQHIFIVNDLVNLKHSGRISTIAALLGMIVKIKPVLELSRQGKVAVLAKALGRKKAVSEMVHFFKQVYIPEMNDFILIGHTGFPDEAAELGEKIKECGLPIKEIKYGYINRLVAGNAGYNSLVVFFMGGNRVNK